MVFASASGDHDKSISGAVVRRTCRETRKNFQGALRRWRWQQPIDAASSEANTGNGHATNATCNLLIKLCLMRHSDEMTDHRTP